MTKQAQGAYERYQNSNMYSIYEAYGKPSQAKVRAWHYCMKLKEEKNGKGLKVIGKSCHFFSAGFTFEEDGKKMFMWITPSTDRAFEIC